MTPKVSVIICTYNRATFLAQAIDSVLSQTFQDFEIIIVDDASTDNTQEILKKYTGNQKIRIIKNEKNLGISKSRNIGLKAAYGIYIAVLDSDDAWTDTQKLQKQFDFLEQNTEYVLIGSNAKIVNEKKIFIKNTNLKIDDLDIRKKILLLNQIIHSAVMYRKEMIEKIDGYDEKLSCVEDLDIFLKMGLLGKMKNLPEITTAYTRHSGGTSHKRKIAMAWNNYLIVWKNFGKYPNWILGMSVAKLRLLKNLF